jgi:serine/threonine protein kinase
MVDRAGGAIPREGTPDPLLGRVVNEKFKILSFIARGGMGKVYRAEQAPLGRVCALKVLNANYTGEHDPEFHKRFFLEASLTSKLRHPNTVTIFDYGQTDDGIYYMAMEYLEGYTLHRAIRQVGYLPEERAAYIARQICRSLREAHSLGVVHRDLKPANVYLLEHGDEPDFVKVLDFGLVKDIATGAEELTQAGLYMGSPKYMAPEQMSGATIDARTDIYALGVILYEMVTGKVPFDRPKSLEILMAHLKEEPPPLRQANPAARVSPAMEETIFRAMAKDPNNRFRSMDEVLAALKRLGPAFVAEPSTSLSDRQSATGSGLLPAMGTARPSSTATGSGRVSGAATGPTASQIIRSAGAAMAVPTETAPVPTAETPEAAAKEGSAPSLAPEATPRRSRAGVLAFLIGAAALAVGIGYGATHADGKGGTAAAPPAAEPTPLPGAPGVTSAPGPTTTAASTASGGLESGPTTAGIPAPGSSSAGATPAASLTQPPPPGGKAIPEVDVHTLRPAQTVPPVPPQGPLARPPVPVAGPPPKAPPAAAAKPPAGAAPGGTKGAPDCNPSYYYDSDGNKHFRPECFGR